MKRSTALVMAGMGAGAGFVATRLLTQKRINTLPFGYGIKVKKAVTVNKPADQLYAFWRNLENVSKLIGDVVSIKVIDSSKSHWTLRAPGGFNLEWDAEITVDRRNEMIGWRSLDGADIDNAGYVRFERATGGRGSVVRVALQYNPPAGKVGAALAALLGESPAGQIEHALRKFKQLMEAGEVPTTSSEKQAHLSEIVEEASEESFPASDAPAWTGTRGPV